MVDAWLDRSAAIGLPRERLLDLFEAALAALWASTSTTLGTVTLTAIGDRVLHNAAVRYPAFAALTLDPQGRIDARALRGTTASMSHMKLVEAMRSLLVEFLTVIGNLTAELLTPELHAELSAVADHAAARRPTRAAKPDQATRKDAR